MTTTMPRALAAAALIFAGAAQAQQSQADEPVLSPGLPQTLEILAEERVDGGIWDSAQQVGQRCLRMDLAPSSYVMRGTKLEPKAQRFITIGIFRDDRCADKEVIVVGATGRSKSLQFKSEGGTFYAKVKSNPGPVALGLKMIPQTEIFSIGRGADILPASTPRVTDAVAPMPAHAADQCSGGNHNETCDALRKALMEKLSGQDQATSKTGAPPAVHPPLPGDPANWGILSQTVGRFYRDSRVAVTWFSFRWSEEDQKLFRQDFTFGMNGISDFEFRVTKKGKLKCEAVNTPIFQTIKPGPDGELPLGACGMGMKIVDGILKTGVGTELVEATPQEYAAAYQKQVASVAAWEQRQEAEKQARKGSGGGLFSTLLGAAVGGVAAVAGGADASTAAGLMMQGAAVTSGNGQMAAAMAKGSAEIAASNAQLEAQLQGSINRGLAQGSAQYRAAQGGHAGSASTNVTSQAGSSQSSRTGGEGSAAPAGSGTISPAEAQYIETLYYVCTANAPPRDGGPRDDWYVSRLAPVRVSTRGGAQDLIVTPPWRDYIKAQVPGATAINCNGDTDRSKIEVYRARIVSSKWTSYEVDYTPQTP